MTAGRDRRGSRLLVALAAAPAALLAVAAAVTAVSGDARTLVIEASIPAALLVAAAALAATVALGVLWRRSVRDAAARARAAMREEAASEHRRFLARLDHELKNPITAVRAAVAASVQPTPQLETIDAQTARLGRLVGDLRKLSELRTAPIEQSRVDVGELVADVVDAIRDAHGREAIVTLPAAPWPLPGVTGDPDLLFAALFNVVSNAAKYSDADDVIEVRGHEQAGAVVLEVGDTGRGIPADDLDGVFDELARAGNARDRPGSGLGLALVRTIVERHGGEVALTSREGQGTRARIVLPAAPRV